MRFSLEKHFLNITLYNLQLVQVRNCSTEDSNIMNIWDQQTESQDPVFEPFTTAYKKSYALSKILKWHSYINKK